jgi:hypothetical protein
MESRLPLPTTLASRGAKARPGLVREHLRHVDLAYLDQAQVDRASRLVGKLALRAEDALHPAAALSLSRELGRKAMRFLTVDVEQAEAASREGLRLIKLGG